MVKRSNSDDESDKDPVTKGKSASRIKRRNKPKDFPKRPLSSYNVFFKETREEILAKNKEGNGDEKVDFQTMAKEIAARWRNLEKKGRDRVERLAQKDMLRYRDEVKSYEDEMVKKNRKQREEAAAEKQNSAKRLAIEKAANVAAQLESLDRVSVGAGLPASVATGSASLAGMGASTPLNAALLMQHSQQGKQELQSLNAALLLQQHAQQGNHDLQTLNAALLMQQQAQQHSQQGINDVQSLNAALLWQQQAQNGGNDLLQQQLLEQLWAVEAREMQLRRIQNLGLLQGDNNLGLSAAIHQLGGFGGAAHLGAQGLQGSGLGGHSLFTGPAASDMGLPNLQNQQELLLRDQALVYALLSRQAEGHSKR